MSFTIPAETNFLLKSTKPCKEFDVLKLKNKGVINEYIGV
jgi:hypothetical protein